MYNKSINFISILLITILILLIFINSSFAQLGLINLRISANLVSNTCVVNSSSKNKVVDMKTWASKYFDINSVRETPPVQFKIELENCGPASNSVHVRFSGNVDDNNNQLFSLSSESTAKNIGISILDENLNVINPNSKTKNSYKLNGTNNISLIFYAKYVATGSPVMAGSANSEATFELEYL